MTVQTRLLHQREYEDWDRFVRKSSAGTIYSTAVYLESLSTATGGQFRILAAFQGEQLFGGVGLYEEGPSERVRMTNRLLLYYNGFVLRDFETQYPSERTSRTLAVLSALEKAISEMPYSRIIIHQPRPLIDARLFMEKGWNVEPSYTYLVALEDLKATWQRIEQNQRRLIRRSQEHGMLFVEDDDFDSFYSLHLQTARRKCAPIYLAESEFRRYFSSLRSGDLCRLFQVRNPNGECVATQLVLTGRHNLSHTVCAAADERALKLGVTPFLRWRAFEKLASLGFRANDLTDAALNSVTRFKSQLGGELTMNLVLARNQRKDADSLGRKLRRRLSRLRRLR